MKMQGTDYHAISQVLRFIAGLTSCPYVSESSYVCEGVFVCIV